MGGGCPQEDCATPAQDPTILESGLSFDEVASSSENAEYWQHSFVAEAESLSSAAGLRVLRFYGNQKQGTQKAQKGAKGTRSWGIDCILVDERFRRL